MKRSEASGTFIRLVKLGRPYIGWYIALCLAAAVISLTSVGLAEALRRIINAATEHNISSLASSAIFALAIVLVDVVFNFLKSYLSAVLEYKSTSRLQLTLLDKLLKVKMKDLDRYHSADLISRIHDSAPAAQQGINLKTVELFSSLLQILFLLTYLMSLHFTLTMGILLICALLPLVMLPFTSRIRSLYRKRQEVEAAQQVLIQDSVQGAEVVRAFSLASRLQQQFMERVQHYFKFHVPLSRAEAVGYNMNFTVILGGLLYLLTYGGYLVIGGRLDVGAVAAFLISFEQITNPVSRLSNLWAQLQTSLAQGSRIFELFELHNEQPGQEQGVQKQTPGQQQDNVTASLKGLPISFNNVSFSYSGNPVLQQVQLAIEPGKVTALAGPSGSGKSTLLRLLLAEYEPDNGTICCGSQPLGTLSPQVWRSSLAYVSQEPYLFSGTLYENIAWGRSGAAKEEVIQAARDAGIHEFIMSTPLQYETVIGERGITLSGGERQRLSIARAFVRGPELLLLDEPTAALDSHSEEVVQQALQKLMQGRTTVVIAHRLSTIRNADTIYYMEAGSVVEEGTHPELMAMEGKYYNMVQSVHRTDHSLVPEENQI
ncbi:MULTISPECIES: ABC transporter ATP-binding protein [unclassified Paenibacillus]|uniref:ABC transporter ATP-binding protein n=1 Tax=unclassified Paenibacillus TaxID=185978 RepID=UPI002405808C|nr:MULTISPECIES: ABC transporter ATP-binding protein [unclassified Paenibacillus]MDF9844790.1 ABC-type multidrug transport system fused ATPase/permease subunit [Paenibacillus sp. PastF-2]MDF9851409.1 ABC-type multidrug transport system fused ATPase/permease subunit [Paenibacillus sp. PastM-2]MDF9857974.1 ABC-type multidrug transport system fused ATPase/permease subunit [Paenibacillus sp. PastF-1]MDH6483242.1 ABC-type multidrug transport system fused ATPase/permease subunit [Paenibacillus sp. Pa